MRTMEPLDKLVAKHPFLTGLDPQFLQFLTDCATVRRFAAQQQIFREGNEADHFYLIVSGRVSLETDVPGSGLVTIQVLGPGDALGWSWLFPPYQWHFTAKTLAPTEVISFTAADLREKAARNRDFQNEMLIRISRTLLQRLQGTRREMVKLLSKARAATKNSDEQN
jgi:CRP/FNR family transcriptional regulator, cyclic AMP receptor protein